MPSYFFAEKHVDLH